MTNKNEKVILHCGHINVVMPAKLTKKQIKYIYRPDLFVVGDLTKDKTPVTPAPKFKGASG